MDFSESRRISDAHNEDEIDWSLRSSRIEFTFCHADSLYRGYQSLLYHSSIGHHDRVPTQTNKIFGTDKKPESVEPESENSPSVIQIICKFLIFPYNRRIVSMG